MEFQYSSRLRQGKYGNSERRFNTTAINFGDLTVTGTGTGQATDAEGQTVTFVKLKPGGNTNAIAWNVKPVKGLTFTPTKVSAYIQRFGTDAENGVVVTALLEDGTSEVLGTYTAPRNNKSQSENKFGKMPIIPINSLLN